MSDISRVDRIIGVALVVLLVALLAVAVAHRSGPVHTAAAGRTHTEHASEFCEENCRMRSRRERALAFQWISLWESPDS